MNYSFKYAWVGKYKTRHNIHTGICTNSASYEMLGWNAVRDDDC